ncbi:serine hydrolase domain-containing protein [Glacieibacterium frigidum]|uniref:serine hydrolase domain-containing protein n=1 Tax=Glacieibacterium frigidum TaxID=2593303 RepID=UPI00163D75BE|nr:serine hydrolase [Glacieibacterium frigidum]
MTRPAGMTAANWRAHPYAPWAFRNVAAFLPVATVPAGRATPLPDGRPLDGVDLAGTHVDGLIVVHRGAVVQETYAEGMTAATRHLCFSVTKSLVGLLAELLIADGAIDPAATADTLVPELAGTAFGGATLRALLDMVDGVPFDETYADDSAQIHHYSKHFWGDGEGGVLAALQALPSAAPGAGFAYRTAVSDVVGLMLERSTNQPLEVLVARHIWGPAGAADDAHWVRDTGGRVIASAGFACTLRDLARVGVWLLGLGGPAAASIARGGDRAAFAASGQCTRPGYSYRSHWWIDHAAGAWNALGVFGQRLHVVPDADLVIARFGSHPVASNVGTDALHARAFAAVRAALEAQ